MIQVIKFWAPRCGPCRAFKPLFEKWAEKYSGIADFVAVNVDEDQATTADFGIRVLPTVLVVKGNKVVAKHEGIPRLAFLAPYLKREE